MSKFAASVVGVLALLFAGTGAANAAEPEAAGPSIDLAICLDVSGSMEGLLQSAKSKLWDVVNDLARIKPTPNLRVALYSYGSKSYLAQAGWVRKEVDLTSDLDAIYQKLNGLAIVYAGPGNSNEYVARVCRDAVEQQKWSAGPKTLRIIFVCGNEPANQDPDVTLASVAEKALARDIVINSIYCGSGNHADAAGWSNFAGLAKGQFSAIDQNRAPVVVATPLDKELAELSAKLSETYVAYGKIGGAKLENQRAQDANALQQGRDVAAARAASKATGLYRNATWDLVDRLKEDPKFDIKKLADDDFCDTLKKLKPEEREAFVKEKAAQRDALQKKIADLSAKRQAYIQEELKKQTGPNGALDAAIRGALRKQAESKGIKIPD